MNHDPDPVSWVYMTAGSNEEAKRIGRMLVRQKLAACVNLLEGMTSIYRWNNELQEDRETVLIAKTRKTLIPELVKTVQSEHSYDCPCVIELPVQGGNPDFLDWIRSETSS